MSGSTLSSRPTRGTALPATYVTATGLPRYKSVSQALHWLTAAFALAVLPLAWVAISLPNSELKGTMFTLHKSVGLTILAIVVIRIVWRMIHPAPADPAAPKALEVIARINHWLLYAIFLIMPVSGYLLSALSGRSTAYFWLFTIPGWTRTRACRRRSRLSTSSASTPCTCSCSCTLPARSGTSSSDATACWSACSPCRMDAATAKPPLTPSPEWQIQGPARRSRRMAPVSGSRRHRPSPLATRPRECPRLAVRVMRPPS